VKLDHADSAASGHFTFETEKNLLPVALSINGETGRLTGLVFRSAYPRNITLESVKRKFTALPGRAGFLALKLNPPSRTLEALNENTYFAVGSAFKLYLLGTILEEEYSWGKIFILKEGAKSLPPGRMRELPVGSPLAVHTLAAAMISKNDNTASDTLADGLGRGVIEGALARLGHSKPELLKPFLTTSEVFRLRRDTGTSLKYLNAEPREKYRLLAGIADRPLGREGIKASPFGADKIGWPASPADLCRLMDYFYKKADKSALEILGAAPGMDIPEKQFLYAGYKGAAEPGVLNMTWLLKTPGSDWYCITGSWNSENENLEERKFFELMRAAVNAMGDQVQEPQKSAKSKT
jgi:hypothetical protein